MICIEWPGKGVWIPVPDWATHDISGGVLTVSGTDESGTDIVVTYYTMFNGHLGPYAKIHRKPKDSHARGFKCRVHNAVWWTMRGWLGS